MTKVLICPKWVVPIVPQNTVLEKTYIALENGFIERLIPEDAFDANEHFDEVIELPDHAIMPGLINTHCHSPMVLLRGFGSDLPLAKWLQDHIWQAESALVSPEFVRDGMHLALAEMLLHGITCFSEHYFYPEIACEVTQELSMRALVGLWLGHVPTPWSQHIDDCFKKNLSFLQNHQDNDQLRIAWAPHSLYLVPDQPLLKLKQYLDQDPRRVHIHCHETQKEINQSLLDYNARPLGLLDQLGLINDHTIAVHMVDVLPEEAQLLHERGAHVVTCPNSNLKLASGLCPTPRLLEHNVNLAIGTDGAASNNGLDLLQEARKACYLTKALGEDPTLMPAHQMLEMLTINGAKALGFDHVAGSIEVGKAGDLIAFDLSHFTCYPQHDIQALLAYACPSQRISHVWSQGTLQVKDGKLHRMDPEALRALAVKWQHKTQPFA